METNSCKTSAGNIKDERWIITKQFFGAIFSLLIKNFVSVQRKKIKNPKDVP